MSPRRPDLDGLDQEFRDHIDAETADNVAKGMTPDEAHAAALRKFGNLARAEWQKDYERFSHAQDELLEQRERAKA